MFNKRSVDDLGQFIINELAKELIKQDHRATGKLIASLDYKVLDDFIGTVLRIEMNDYGEYVNVGRKRGAAKVPINALVDWIKVKGIESNNKKALGIAFAIQKTIQKEGIPTRKSRSRGKKVEFVDDTLARIEMTIVNKIEELAGKTVETTIDNFIKKV